MELSQTDQQKLWYKKVLFTVQLIVLVSMLITSIINIVMKTGNLPLWTALMGSSLGYLLPTPKMKTEKSEAAIHPNINAESISP